MQLVKDAHRIRYMLRSPICTQHVMWRPAPLIVDHEGRLRKNLRLHLRRLDEVSSAAAARCSAANGATELSTTDTDDVAMYWSDTDDEQSEGMITDTEDDPNQTAWTAKLDSTAHADGSVAMESDEEQQSVAPLPSELDMCAPYPHVAASGAYPTITFSITLPQMWQLASGSPQALSPVVTAGERTPLSACSHSGMSCVVTVVLAV